MMIIALLLAASPPAPDADARAFGLRLAKTTTLATLLPIMAAKETAELIAAHPELSADEQRQLRQLAEAQSKVGIDRLLAAEGDAYATHLSKDDLRVLVTAGETEAAKRMRTVLPMIVRQTMESARGLDFKGDTLKQFCAKTGKLCP